MDFGTLITTITILVLIALPFVLISIGNRKNKKQILKNLRKLATEKGTELDQFDIWKSTGIGLCKDNHTLVFYRKTKDNEESHQIDLSETNQCKAKKIMHTDAEFSDVEKVVMELTNSSKKTIVLELFNTHTDTSALGDEIATLDKWDSIVSSRLTKN